MASMTERQANMARMFCIVARDKRELLEFLRRDFAAEEAEGVIEIFSDRRLSPPGQGAQPESDEPRRDRRRNADVARSFRDLGCAFVRRS